MTAAFEVSERYVAQRLSVLGTVERAEVRESSLGQYYAVMTMSEWADSNVHRSILGGHLAGINDFYRGEDVAVHLHVKSGTTLDPPLPEGWIRLQCPGEVCRQVRLQEGLHVHAAPRRRLCARLQGLREPKALIRITQVLSEATKVGGVGAHTEEVSPRPYGVDLSCLDCHAVWFYLQ